MLSVYDPNVEGTCTRAVGVFDIQWPSGQTAFHEVQVSCKKRVGLCSMEGFFFPRRPNSILFQHTLN